MQNNNANITVIRKQTGQPHAGKVFAAVHAHLSDVPYYAAGLCARLISEGYTGYLIRTTNDEKSGRGSIAENILSNEQEHLKMAEAVGSRMSPISTIEAISWTPSQPWRSNRDWFCSSAC